MPGIYEIWTEKTLIGKIKKERQVAQQIDIYSKGNRELHLPQYFAQIETNNIKNKSFNDIYEALNWVYENK